MELSNDLLKLTAREVQILGMTAEGMTAKEIADYFHISRRTVEKYREEISDKLGARCLAHAVLLGIRIGIIA
jgi:two-component system invasion response regulator UvrY